jgi:hypothetical protein
MKDPIPTLKKLLIAILRSMAFLGTFIVSMRFFLCLFCKIRGRFDIFSVLVMSVFSTLPVLFENISRIEAYTVFTIPRVLEGIWDLLKKLGYVRNIPYAMPLLFSASMAVLLLHKKHYSSMMPGTYQSLIRFIYWEDRKREDTRETSEAKIEEKPIENI